VAAIVGSLRRDSYTRRLTEALARLAGDSMRIQIVPIRDPMSACIKNALDVGSRSGANHAVKAFDADGELVNTSTRELCEKFVRSFETWIRRITGK
jgi:NAD(P)H-dependent FMN reductase